MKKLIVLVVVLLCAPHAHAQRLSPQGGDITSVGATAGGGLTGGATSGAALLGLLRTCLTGEILKWDGSAWGCAADATGGGGISGLTTNKVAKATSATTIGDSQIVDDGTRVYLPDTSIGSVPGNAHTLAGTLNANSTAGTNGQVLKIVGGLPQWSTDADSGGDITGVTTAGPLSGGCTSGTCALTTSMATARILGRTSASTGVAEQLTGTQVTAMLDTATASLKGLVPASGGGTSNFYRADGTWAAPPGANALVTNNAVPRGNGTTQVAGSITDTGSAVSVASTSSAPLSVTTTNTATTDTVFTGTRSDTATAGDQTAIAIGQGSPQFQLIAETVNTSDLGAKFRLNTRWFNGSTYSNPNDLVVSGGSVGINQDISGLTYALQVSKSVNNTRAALFDGATVVTGGYLSVPNGNGASGGYQIDGADTLYRGAVDGHLYLKNPYNVAGGGAYDIIVEPSSSDGSIRFRTNGGMERLRISDGGTVTLTGNLTANGTTGTTGQVLKIVSGSPQWSADASGLGSQTITTTGTYDDYALSPDTTTITSTSAGTVTLRSMTGGVAGRCVNIINAGASVLDIAHDGGGTTTNRFALSGNVSWRQHVNEIVTACYGADDRWHIDRTRQIGAPFVTTTSASIGTTLGVTGNTSLQGSVNTIGDANTDTMVVNAGSTFNHTVVLGDATADQTDLKSRLTDTASGVTLSSCGTSPSRTTGTNAFTITVGTGTATSCTVTFATAYANEPTCSVTRRDSAGRTDIYFSSRTASGFTWTNAGGANMAGQLYDVICVGH